MFAYPSNTRFDISKKDAERFRKEMAEQSAKNKENAKKNPIDFSNMKRIDGKDKTVL